MSELAEIVGRHVRYANGESPYRTWDRSPGGRMLSILDEFSQMCFSPVANLCAVGSSKAELDIQYLNPEMLFVESAWSGNHGEWRYRIATGSGLNPALPTLIEGVRKADVPTVFWNKEDPVHFNDFLEAAKLFDFVFTTDGDLLPTYRSVLGHDRVGLLRFFAEPTIHNPRMVDRYRQGGIAFGGQYFRDKYPERREQMDILFAGAAGHEFAIFSRVLGGDEKYQFPEPYAGNVIGSLPYREMTREYKRHKVFINVNSVISSSTMCARRIYELAACKTPVISLPSTATASVFEEGEVTFVESVEQARAAFDRLLSDDTYREGIGQRAWRAVARRHLTTHRLNQIRCTVLGREEASKPLRVTLYVDDQGITPQLVADLERQSVVRDGSVNVSVVARRGGAVLTPSSHIHVTRDEPDGCADFVGEVSGIFRYGEHYLEDLLLWLTHFGPELAVTKSMWTLGGSMPVLRETAVSHMVPGAWLAKAELLDTHPEIRDGSWKEATDKVGFETYASDPFNIVEARQSGGFTWEN